MARSWEYSSQRRIAMQVAMWVILGLTLALAGFVSRHKHQEFSTSLSQPIAVGDLMIRLPRGWHYGVFRSGEVLVVRGTEPGDENQRAIRVVQVTQERTSDTAINAEGYLANNVLNSDMHVTPIQFSGLKSDGVSTEIQEPEEETASQPGAPAGVYAATLAPLPGAQRLAVVVSVEDIAPFTQADHDALRQIADSITLAAK